MSRNAGIARPAAFSTKSFTRYEPAAPVLAKGHRHRASTLDSSVASRLSGEQERQDVFNSVEPDVESQQTPDLDQSDRLPDDFDQLPIELASLTDRFIESLGQKAFEQPPTIDQIADLFQDFYIRASTSISIHISTLITRLNRDQSPKPLRASGKTKTLPSRIVEEVPATSTGDGAQQMLTASEVTEKRKARKMLEFKRLVLEEAVERRACEKVYHKIWRHKNTLDEVQDEKLRSKTAALALVGIGLKDLGIEVGQDSQKSLEDVQELLLPARDGLMKMNDEKSPLGKLQHLTKAHKAIVDTLYSIHGSSSSADEILPTLIYTLITSPVEGISIISNLNFIQRFRTASKIDGEAAYCITNLEAAISFLENVDLASLRADEAPEGPRRNPSQPATPVVEKADPLSAALTRSPSAISAPTFSKATPDMTTRLETTVPAAKALPSPRHQRTLSDLFHPVAAANEAVRMKANEGLENITSTLDNSFKFLFGRLKEKAADPKSPSDMIVPKTLDEAMQLVSKPVGPDEDSAAISETSSLNERDTTEGSAAEKGDRILSLFGGKKAPSVRDRSVDSQRSNASSRRVTFSSAGTAAEPVPMSKEGPASAVTPSKSLDSMKNLGSSLNPFSNLGNAFGSGFGRFGRSATSSTTNVASPALRDLVIEPVSEGHDQAESTVNVSLESPNKVASKIRSVPPPIKRFIELEDSSQLRIKDVHELLEDYKRLANLLADLAKGDTKANSG